mmetsp:Transcript_10829/g.26538  ORF Transcript_10829/g.26538 Transcript_10829/m.26538 type:complete len:145 (+) Transcript_10829:211-645(+)|eukprot:CAMPEP_0178993186 /NCGR_PEP_ID=MMETSP0795-20121207/6562_1 /TAXON_ID=88552 /ORGANISM="Amoebophrya sp., Strain Ameob2" /LENGTH=144 /DNA_ID=CAMNT_0020685215 /DNA_START=192 /DNA_END=626 /DNA_ORIENTATION=-
MTEKFENSKQFNLDFYKSTDDGFSTCSAQQNKEVERLVDARKKKASTPGSIVNDPDVRKFLQPSDEQKGKELDARLQGWVKTRMRRDNVANLFQTPKMREEEPSTARQFQPITDAEPVDRTYYFKRDDFKDYSEDLIKYRHTMR